MPKFEFIKNEIEGLVVIKPTVFGDSRGFFMETFHKEEFSAAGIDKDFVQDNHSKSTKGVLRGLHFQTQNTQGKLVRVIKGEVFDVAVDTRPNSKTFGQWYGLILSEENKLQFYVPEGFAHGFLVMSDEAEFVYKCTDIYNPQAEGGLLYNDESINITWPDIGCEFKLSDKDKLHKPFNEQDFKEFLKY